MKRIIPMIIIVSLVFISCVPKSYITKDIDKVGITTEALPWVLEFPDFGCKLVMENVRHDGKAAYVLFTTLKPYWNISFFIEPALKCKDPKSCRDFSVNANYPIRNALVGMDDYPECSTAAYMNLPTDQKQVNTKHVYAHFVREGYWIDMHISKGNFEESDQAFFENVFLNVNFRQKVRK